MVSDSLPLCWSLFCRLQNILSCCVWFLSFLDVLHPSSASYSWSRSTVLLRNLPRSPHGLLNPLTWSSRIFVLALPSCLDACPAVFRTLCKPRWATHLLALAQTSPLPGMPFFHISVCWNPIHPWKPRISMSSSEFFTAHPFNILFSSSLFHVLPFNSNKAYAFSFSSEFKGGSENKIRQQLD